MFNLELGSDPASGTAEAAVTGKDHANHAVVKVCAGHNSVEWTLGKGALRTSAGRRRTLAGNGANVVHEQLGDFLVVDGVEDAKRSNLDAIEDIGRVVAAAADHIWRLQL